MGQSSGSSIPCLWFLTFLGYIWWWPRGDRINLDPKSGSDLETDDSTHVIRENGKHDSHNETFWGRAGQASRQASNGLWLLCGRGMGQVSIPKLRLLLPDLNFLPAPKRKALGFLRACPKVQQGDKVKQVELESSEVRHQTWSQTLYYKSHGSFKKVMNSKDNFPEKNTHKHIWTKF